MEKTLPELFLEKLELLTKEERLVLIESIRLFNTPIFINNESPVKIKRL